MASVAPPPADQIRAQTARPVTRTATSKGNSSIVEISEYAVMSGCSGVTEMYPSRTAW